MRAPSDAVPLVVSPPWWVPVCFFPPNRLLGGALLKKVWNRVRPEMRDELDRVQSFTGGGATSQRVRIGR